jgi:hypothetical protein
MEKHGAPRYRRSLRDWLALGVAVAASLAWLLLMLRGR